MAVLKILHFPEPLLKEKSRPVPQVDPTIRQLSRDMAETMYSAPGVGLAAPQVGHSLRLVVIDVTPSDQAKSLMVLINPEIVSTEGECMWEEGCLSIPDCTEEVKRKQKVTVRYQTLEGDVAEVCAEGLLAIVLQHEIDHLDGILFIDRLSSLKRRLIRRKFQKKEKEKEEDRC